MRNFPKNTLLVVLLILVGTACRRQYALVQPAKPEFYEHKKRAVATQIAEQPQANVEAVSTVEDVDNQEVISEVSVAEIAPVVPNVRPKKLAKVEKPTANARLAVPVAAAAQVQMANAPFRDLSKKTQKGGSGFQQLNSYLMTGLIFLGVAILFSILHLSGLSILFGIASIIFIFLGLRQMQRRQRRRNLFS